MPDICMCSGKECPLKEKCYRFLAKPSCMQSYFAKVPFKEGSCEYFVDVNKEFKD